MFKSQTNILEQAKAGSKEAFGLIVKQYQSLVCAITYNATGDIELSEELAQETFLTAWEKLSELRDINKIGSWLCGIARNKSGDLIRKAKLQNSVQPLPVELNEGLEKSTASTAEKNAISKETQQILWQSLGKIPDIYREPMILFYRQQQSIAQVAGGLGLSEDVIRQRLSRGRKLLKKEVEEFVEDMLGQTGPGEMFTMAVVASLPAIPQLASAAIMATMAKNAAAVKFANLLSLIGGLMAPLLSFIGTAFAIRPTIKNMSPRERKFLGKCMLIQIVYLVSLTAIWIPFVLWWRLWLSYPAWIPFIIVIILVAVPMIPFMIWTDRRHKQIQIEEGTYAENELRKHETTELQIYGAFCGAIFGSLLWLFRLSLKTEDWLTFSTIWIVGILIFIIATKLTIRNRQHGFKITAAVFAVIGLFHLLIINLRWEAWKQIIEEPHIGRRHINFVLLFCTILLFLIATISDWWLRRIKKQ